MPHVQKYINEWDKGVTQEFQKRAEQLKPYTDLGVDIDSIRAAITVMQLADSDPVGFYNYVGEQLREMGLLEEIMSNGQENPNPLPPEFEGVPEQFAKEHIELRQRVDKAEQFMNSQNEAQENAQREAQLDKLLKDLENKHGKFDHHAVLGRMISGMNPEDAVSDWKKSMAEFNSPERRNPPPVIGAGRTVAEQVDTTKLRDNQTRKALVRDLLGGIDQ